jgi:hypothetical protein
MEKLPDLKTSHSNVLPKYFNNEQATTFTLNFYINKSFVSDNFATVKQYGTAFRVHDIVAHRFML